MDLQYYILGSFKICNITNVYIRVGTIEPVELNQI